MWAYVWTYDKDPNLDAVDAEAGDHNSRGRKKVELSAGA